MKMISKKFMFVALFSLTLGTAWIAAQPAHAGGASSAGGQIGPGTSNPQQGNNSGRDTKSNVNINAVKKNCCH